MAIDFPSRPLNFGINRFSAHGIVTIVQLQKILLGANVAVLIIEVVAIALLVHQCLLAYFRLYSLTLQSGNIFFFFRVVVIAVVFVKGIVIIKWVSKSMTRVLTNQRDLVELERDPAIDYVSFIVQDFDERVLQKILASIRSEKSGSHGS